jgi:hypothetical protein
VFSNGDGRDLEVIIYSDPNFSLYMLPVTYVPSEGAVEITPNVTINY